MSTAGTGMTGTTDALSAVLPEVPRLPDRGLAGVGTLVYQGKEHRVGSGEVGAIVKDLRARLVGIQNGEVADSRGWLERIER